MIYKITQGEDASYSTLYYIFLKEDDIDYIETVERESYGSYRIHLKREVEFLEGEPEKKIYLKSLTDMEVFPS